jgi:hypothetical protein
VVFARENVTAALVRVRAMIFDKPLVYYLATVSPGPRVVPVRELSPGEFAEFTLHRNTIIQHYNDSQTYFAALLNFKSFISAFDELSSKCAAKAGNVPTMFGGVQLVLSVNRHLLNYLSSCRTFVDHTETCLKRRHGANSERLSTFKSAASAAFDSSFSYRFLSQLRNYVQHCGMPVGKMSVHIDFDEERKTPVSQHLELLFSRDALVNNYDRWHRMVGPELEAMPEYFPIRPHVEKMMVGLDGIQLALLIAELPSLLHSFQWLDTLMHEAAWRGGTPTVARENSAEDDAEVGEIDFTDFPVEMMEFIRRPLLKHREFGRPEIAVPCEP